MEALLKAPLARITQREIEVQVIGWDGIKRESVRDGWRHLETDIGVASDRGPSSEPQPPRGGPPLASRRLSAGREGQVARSDSATPACPGACNSVIGSPLTVTAVRGRELWSVTVDGRP